MTKESVPPEAAHPSADELYKALVQLLGEDRVITREWERRYYSTDIYGGGQMPAMVIRPQTAEQVANACRMVTAAGFSIIGRGGGTSYTGGITPDRQTSVIVDTAGLNRIIEINRDDMYVTVEAGVTWEMLHDALKDTDVRTPFWGPFSGSVATVGGSLSQNAVLWGSTAYDISAASVLGLQVALADGSLLTTGSAAWGGKPFFRNQGPDITGLFLGDSGALGIKTTATLRLMRRPREVRMASFNFTERSAMSRAMVAVAREGVAATCFGMDPVLQYQRVKRASTLQGLKAIKGVVTTAESTFSGIRAAIRIAVAGKRFIDEHGYSFHMVLEGRDKKSADAKLTAARKICLEEGKEIANSVPTMAYGAPFVGMTTAIGPDGERWAPMHGLFALSDGDAAWARIEALLDEYTDRFDQHGIVVGVLLALISSTVFVIEPVFYWPGPRTVWYEGMLEPGELAKYKDYADDPAVNATVAEVRQRLNELFAEMSAMHMQIGKRYRYVQGLRQPALALVEGIKSLVDPDRLMNPKSLGFE